MKPKGNRDDHPSTVEKPPVVLHTRVVTGTGGGIDKTILNSPRFLSALGYQSLCAIMRTPRDPGFAELRRKADQWQAPLIEIDDRGPLDLKVITKLLSVCRQHNVSIWHSHEYKSNLLGVLLRRRRRMKLVATVHGWGSQPGRTPLYHAIDRFSLRFYDRVICVSSDLHEACLSKGVPQSRLLTIGNAIDAQQFCRRRTRAEAKQRLGIPVDRIVIGGVGRLAPEKAFDTLIRSVGELVNLNLNVGLIIAGEGEQLSNLERLISEGGLHDRVRLLGYCAEMNGVYEAMDVFALSSLREGLPNAVLEAMALNVPVAATCIAGLPNIIAHQQDGLLVKPGCQAELTAALRRLATSEHLRRQFEVAGRRTIESRFSFHRRMERVKNVYDDLLHQE